MKQNRIYFHEGSIFQHQLEHPFAPTVDGKILPQHPFDPVAPAISAHVPMLIGATLNEMETGIAKPELEAMTETDLAVHVYEMYGIRNKKIIAAYRQLYPQAKPFDILSVIAAMPRRQNAVTQAIRQSLQKGQVYQYLFSWQSPVLDGRPRAYHCAELPFVFDNIDRCVNMTGGGANPQALAAKVRDAWIAFARTGTPNHRGLPQWNPFTVNNQTTMIFDNKCEVKIDHDGEARNLITS